MAPGELEPNGSGRSGALSLCVTAFPFTGAVVWSVISRQLAPLTGTLLLYSCVAVVVHVLHILGRVLSGQLKVVPGRARWLVVGELVFAVAWGFGVDFARQDRTNWSSPIMVTAVLLLVVFQSHLHAHLVESNAPHVSDWLFTRKIGRHSLEWIANWIGATVPWANEPVRRMRLATSWSVGLLLLVFGVTAAASVVDVGVTVAATMTPASTPPATASPPAESTSGSVPVGAGGGATATTTPPATVPVSTSSTSTPAPDTRTSFVTVCGDDVPLPGHAAPDWAAKSLYDLYFAPGTGVGATIAGCPAPVVVVADDFDEVAYHAGNHDGVLVGVAVVGRSGRQAVVLQPAATFVLEMLEAGVSISPFDRLDVGVGDMWVLWSRLGTTVFVRPGKNAANSNGTYVRLDAEGVRKWLDAMDALGEWLWPRAAADDDAEGLRHVELYDLNGRFEHDLSWSTPQPEDAMEDPLLVQPEDVAARYRQP